MAAHAKRIALWYSGALAALATDAHEESDTEEYASAMEKIQADGDALEKGVGSPAQLQEALDKDASNTAVEREREGFCSK